MLRPASKVPAFVVRKLLNRDARTMLERLRAEIAACGDGTLQAR